MEFQHVKPGKGGAFVRTTLKNVLSGKVVDKTFNAGTKVETANVDKRGMTYLYARGPGLRLHGLRHVRPGHGARRGGRRREELPAGQRRGRRWPCTTASPLYIELPASVEITISQTDPGLQGDRSTGGTKPATLVTGATIQVPLFVTTGEKVKVDTRDGRYIGRVCC